MDRVDEEEDPDRAGTADDAGADAERAGSADDGDAGRIPPPARLRRVQARGG
eukprot:gene4988-20515_t